MGQNNPTANGSGGRAAGAGRQQGRPSNKLTTEGEGAALIPNRTDINRHLFALFQPAFVAAFPDSLIEIAWADPRTDGKINKAKEFSAFDLKAAADFAEQQNLEGYNVYVGAALRRAGTEGRASVEDILAGSHAWCDFDDAGDLDRVELILQQRELPPSHTVVTGCTPHPRFQPFFQLTEAATPDRLHAVNKALHELLGGDPVHSPDHLMRLAGTVNYPAPKKLPRGRFVELTTLKLRRKTPAYAIERLAGVNNPPTGLDGATTRANKTSGNGRVPDHFAELLREHRRDGVGRVGRDDEEILALLEASRIQGKWHNSVRAAIASLVGRGLDESTIRMICAPYCTGGANDPDLDDLIVRGLYKFAPEDEHEPEPKAKAEPKAPKAKADPEPQAEPAWNPWHETLAPRLDHSLLPAVIREAAASKARISGADIDAFAIGYLVGLAACTDARHCVTPKQHATDWAVPLVLWLLLVAPPASMKTDVVKAARSLPASLDMAERERYRRDIEDAKIGAALGPLSATGGVKAADAKREAKRAEAEALQKVPPPRQRVCGDITIEKYAEILAANPGGCAVFRDELSGWLGALGRYTANGSDAADRAFYCALRDGTPHDRQRMSTPDIHNPGYASSFFAAVQMDRLRDMNKKQMLPTSDGLLQRFLPLIMRGAGDYEDIDNNETKDLLRPLRDRLARLSPVMQCDPLGQLVAMPYKLTPEGSKLYKQFANDMRLAGRTQEPSREFAECLMKMGPMWLAFALLFHFIETPERVEPAAQVPFAVVDRVDTIMREFFIPHAEQFYDLINGSTSRLRSAAFAILRCSQDDIVLRDVVRRCHAMQDMDRNDHIKLMQRFETAGWLIRRDGRHETTPRWRRAPGLVARFAGELRREEAARAAVTAAIKKQASERKGRKGGR
jgi:hypothetical protein